MLKELCLCFSVQFSYPREMHQDHRQPLCRRCGHSSQGQYAHVQGLHLRMPNPGFNLGFTPRIYNIQEGVSPGLNPGFGVLRFGLCTLLQIKSPINFTGIRQGGAISFVDVV
jgi:hypothetical protein